MPDAQNTCRVLRYALTRTPAQSGHLPRCDPTRRRADSLQSREGEHHKQIIKNSGYWGARTVDAGFNDKSANPYTLKVQVVEKGGTCDGVVVPPTTLDQVKEWIDTAKASNTWLILVFHQTDNDNANCYGDTPAMLQNIVDYLKTSNVNVVTVSQGLKQF